MKATSQEQKAQFLLEVSAAAVDNTLASKSGERELTKQAFFAGLRPIWEQF